MKSGIKRPSENLPVGFVCMLASLINNSTSDPQPKKKKTHPKKRNVMMTPAFESFNDLKFYISLGRKLVLFKQVVRKEIYTHGCNR